MTRSNDTAGTFGSLAEVLEFAIRREIEAAASYGRVKALWSDPEAAAARVLEDARSDPEPARKRRLGKTLTAVGEALFFFADRQRRQTVEQIRFPTYVGGDYRPPAKPLELMSSSELGHELEARKRESERVKLHIDTKLSRHGTRDMRNLKAMRK